jgi:hypothetical protein
LHAAGLKRIALARENDFRRYLLAECLEAYSSLDEADKQRLHELLSTEQYREVRPLMITTFERGMQQGIERGILQGEQRSALRLLEAKFGPLSAEVKQRVEALSLEALAQL